MIGFKDYKKSDSLEFPFHNFRRIKQEDLNSLPEYLEVYGGILAEKDANDQRIRISLYLGMDNLDDLLQEVFSPKTIKPSTLFVSRERPKYNIIFFKKEAETKITELFLEFLDNSYYSLGIFCDNAIFDDQLFILLE